MNEENGQEMKPRTKGGKKKDHGQKCLWPNTAQTLAGKGKNLGENPICCKRAFVSSPFQK